MVIVAGKMYVAVGERDAYVASQEEFVRQTRNEPGCLDFVITADPIEAGRINLFERWSSTEKLVEFQKRAEPPESEIETFDEDVVKYEISSVGPVF